MSPVRIAVIGAGLIGAKHVAYISASPLADLAAVADPDPAARALADANGAAYWDDVAAMLHAGGIDGAIVATPTATHEEIGLQCVQAGVPAIIEKPIAHTLEAAERLNTAADAAGVTLLTGHHRRYNPVVTQTQAMINRGDLGRLVGVNAMFAISKPGPYFNMSWRRAPGGGPVLTNLIHDIDLMRAIVGEIAEVSAITSSAARGFDTEDSATIALRFLNGALGSIFLSDTAPSPWTWEQGTGENDPYFPESTESAYRFFGTEASLEFPRLKLWRQEAPDWTKTIASEDLAVEEADAFARQIAHFARVIRDEEAPLVSGREGQRTLAATLAVFQAAETGQTVKLG
ncbi:MAG: Gfo/Idh/MocA family oxidoreductase [Pseudomonadota bacterium]